MRILGIDPGLNVTGWGVVESHGNTLHFVAGGVVKSNAKAPMAERLVSLHEGLKAVIAEHAPNAAAVEEVFVNNNARSSLKLGQARGIALLLPQLHGLNVSEYSALEVKKSVVGYGRADKNQVTQMVKILLPKATIAMADTADALAVAICHAHHLKFTQMLKK